MDEKDMKEITVIIEQTVKAVHKDIRCYQENYCVQNTEKLLENYQRLKNFVEYAVSNPSDIRNTEEKTQDMEFQFYSEYDEDFFRQKPDIFIESILASRVRTGLMVAHIDAMTKRLHDLCKADGDKEYDKFLLFYDVYFKGSSCEDSANKYHFSVSQAYRNLKTMVERLSVLLWGVNGLKWML